MTLFEYISVAFSIVLSLAAIRLLGGLSVCLAPGRRYAPHAAWVLLALFNCAFLWWNFWSFRHARWNLFLFLLALAVPSLVYLLTTALVPDSPQTVDSWREHFYRIRGRFFATFTVLMVAFIVMPWLLVGLSFAAPVRLVHFAGLGLAVSGWASRSPRYHAVLPGLMLALLAVAVALVIRPGSLTPGP